ncbi:Peptidase family M23 [Filimonas lacunae]|uniref:Peptidase family M23 n=1 Tax=Filimonas lacunae TaxID=477680 RepID=A0A173MJE0_9BACT|nr:M23 family metallopeptidase [Filimonas lacunae]BAV07589.1 peptidase, M22 family [Filimonas lacunae]SIT29860.1 Peptidase family M23 [Filimonas lacunae]
MKSTFTRSLPVVAIGAIALISIPAIRCGRYRNNPLHRPIELAAGFGEIRPDHFHLGADMRTDGREGLPVYAVKEGYISHVSIQKEKYGKALWITHPDGTTTLYAHLSAFTGKAAQWVSNRQYQQQSWQQETDVSPAAFPVKKGECIGYSGNTGTSEGPHLHFEVRNTATGKSLNPLATVLQVNDTVSPVIKALYWYDRCNSIYEDEAHAMDKNNTRCSSPFIGIGITASDQFATGRFVTGINKAWLYKDNVLQYEFSLQQLSAADTRYVNACIDYARAVDKGPVIQFLFSLPGNSLPYTRKFASGGTIDLSDRKQHEIKIVVDDVAGNRCEKRCRMQYNGSKPCLSPSGTTHLLYPQHTYQMQSAHATVRFPEHTFYDAIPLLLVETPAKIPGAVSTALTMKMPAAPVHNGFTVRLQTSLPERHALRQRTVMLLSGKKGVTILKGKWIQNKMEGLFTDTGTLQLVADTIAPVITHLQLEGSYIQFTCTDNLGALASVQATVNGQWLALDQKNNTFRYQKEEHYPPHARILSIMVTDVAGNVTTRKYTL